MDLRWIVACAVGALGIRVGMAVSHCGLVRSKNTAAMMFRHLVDLCIAVLAFRAVGVLILTAGFRHSLNVTGGDFTVRLPLQQILWFMVLTLISTGIVIGALAECAWFFPSLVASILIAAVLVPLIYLIEEFWLARWSFYDWGMAGPIHLSGAVCAAAAAMVIGSRTGKYNRDGSANGIPGHSIPLVSTGLLLMFVGWFPYLLGRAPKEQLAIITMNIFLAGAAGGLVSLMISRIRFGKPEIHFTYGGFLGALVAISACAPQVSNLSAIIIGGIAGLILPTATIIVELVWKIDDPGGGIAPHGVGAAWGLLAAAIFHPAMALADRFRMFGAQLLGVVAITFIVAGVSFGVFLILRALMPLRVTEAQEFEGLDLSEHDIGAYPDFQQTMIKSYHLREV